MSGHYDLDRPTLLAARLTQARLMQDWRQHDLAVAAGVHDSQIAHWETGRVPTLPLLVRLADALDVSLDWLLGRDTFAAAPSTAGDAAHATDLVPVSEAHAGRDTTTAPTVPPGSQPRAVVVLTPDRPSAA